MLLGVAFLLGVAAALLHWSPEVVHLTGTIGFRPAEQPLLNGLFFLANVVVLEVAILLGWLLVVVLLRANLLMGVVAGGLALSGLVGAGLAVFGGALGLDGDQRGGMAVVAVTLGGFGGLMCAAMVRDWWRGR